MLSFDKEKLHMPYMYKDGIERGQNKTFVIYYRANGNCEEFSYRYIQNESDKLMGRLEKAGLKKGDRIAVVSSLRPWWYALSYTCLRAGYVMVCIDPGVPALQMQQMMLQTGVRACFTTLPIIHLPNELERLVPVYSIDEGFPCMNKVNKVSAFLEEPKPIAEDTFFILFSSGTTSENRKAVLLSHETVTKGIEYGMATDAGIYRKTTAYTPRQRDLMLFPPYHIAGLLCATYDIYCNTQVIMMERLTPNALMNVFQQLKPDNICTVPSMLTFLYKKIMAGANKNIFTKHGVKNALAFSGFMRRTFGIKVGSTLLKTINKQAFGGNMQGFMIGASPFDKTAHQFFLDMGIDVSMAYGLTELGAPLATTGQGYYPGTTGRVVKHTDKIDIRIINKDANGRGEVEVLSPYRMISYMNPKDNEGCFTEDGYFKTGDLGYFDAQNCLNICGRSKESIVLRNGEKLLPEEIENKYANIEDVVSVCAFKVPGDDGCDDFDIAFIKDKTKGIPDAAMIAHIYERAEHLPAMYRPREVYCLKEFPLSSSHKVQRFRLTEMVVNGKNEPVTDASLIMVDEDETTAALRKILVNVGGSQWKNQQLTQGLMLNLDSLSIVNLYVAIQEKWNIDLFQSSEQPETFGDLLDVVKNFEAVDKNDKPDLDLSQYPLPVSPLTRYTSGKLLHLIKSLWRVKPINVNNIPTSTNCLLASNHRTTIDPAFILSCFNEKMIEKTCVIGKAELISDKALKNFVISQNYLPIDRTGNSLKTLQRSEELLNEGYNIVIFPEGTNMMNNTQIYPLKDGAAKLSISTRKPIVPIHINGIAHVDKEIVGFKLPPMKGRVTVTFGKPIYPENKTVEELNIELAQKIQELD